ncbi:long-chain fatty acid transport protein [hydrocarbon metagenome]|uniref:Long-chain fatty acid transport protein n=1 Tax=hydrocarbon metagenome TaxID=938273 RepID=A0A0W8FW90_9ZZZZ
MNSKKFTILIIALFLLFTNLNAGLPTFFPVSSSKVMSLNGIYAAGNDGISSLSTNPAGLGYLNGRGVELSVFGRLGQQDYVRDDGTLFRSFRDDDIGVNIGAFWKISDKITIAADYNNAYQYRVNWPFAKFFEGELGSSVLAFDHFNDYSITSINPSAAINFGSFTIGLSLNIFNIKHDFAFYQGNAGWDTTETQNAAYQVSIFEDAWGFGGTLGIQADLSSDLRIGAFVKSSVSATLEGDARSRLMVDVDSSVSKTSVSSEFEKPWVLGLGVIYKLTDQLTINVDALYNLWGSIQTTQSFTYGNEVWNERLSNLDSLSGYTGGSFPLNFENSFDLGFGIEYDTKSDVTVRLGYRYSQAPNVESNYTMLYPAVDQHWLSFGIGFWFEEFYLDLALAYAVGIEKNVLKDKNFFFPGNYNGNAFVPSVNIKYQF